MVVKVLLIEDDVIDHIAYKRMNKYYDYDITIADSVEAALHILQEKKFDIIILDYLLGNGTAFDIIDLINDTPIIFTTGAGDEETAVKAMKAGVYDYIIKDFERNYVKLLPIIIENALKDKKEKKKLLQMQKQEEEKILAERDRSRSYLDIAGVIIIIIDKDQNIALVNKKCCEILEYEKSEILGINWFDKFVPLSLRDELKDSFNRCMSDEKTHSDYYEYPIVSKNGNEKIIAWHNTLIKDKYGKITGLLCSGEDITMRTEMDNLKSEFINTVSHEIRTPLTIILGICQVLLGKEDLNADILNNYLNIMYSESKRLSDLVNDYLDIQRMENGNRVFVKEKMCIVDVVEDTIDLYSSNKTHKIILDIDKTSYLLINGDYNKIKQVLTNLVSNAIKYSPESNEIAIKIREIDNSICVSVIDHGLGIPKESLTHLFTKFYRVDLSEHLKISGTGLGLAICKEIVTAHDGDIGVKSEIGKGSEFYFRIPFYE